MKKAKRQLSATVVVFAILIVVILAGCGMYIRYLESQNEEEVLHTLVSDTKIGVNGISKEIDRVYGNLANIADVFVHEESNATDEREALLELMSNFSGNEEYLGLGIADLDGNLCTAVGIRMNVSDSENFKKSVNGEPWITSKIVEGEAEWVFVASTPIKKQQEIIGVVYAIFRNGFFEDELQFSDYLEHGRSCIVDSDARILALSSNIRNYQVGDILFQQTEGMNSSFELVKNYENYDGDGAGVVFYDSDTKRVMCYAPLEREGWYVIHSVDEDILLEGKSKVMSIAYLLTGLFIILYLITFWVVMRMQNGHRKKIEQIAYVDELTGGSSFEKFKKDAVNILKNEENTERAIVALDVDKFKFINDVFGYEEGNKVIRYIWELIRDMSKPGEIFAHRRADQYVLLLKVENIEALTQRILDLCDKVSARQTQQDKNYELVLSVGIYIINKNENDILLDNMIDRAEIAKQSVKGKHTERCAFYDDKLRQKILRDQEIESQMEKALENEEFKVYYQPKYDSRTCELAGAEALVRWYSESGMIFPNEFIPLFEANGFIVELDRYMFDKVCRDIRKWLDEGYQVVPVSVNLSQLQLYNTSFIEEYREIMEKHHVPSEYVQLELTETTLFSEAGKLNDIIDRLHSIGIRILMDDFGTGYSSLTMLKNVSVDVLKLDKSFVDDIGEPKVDIVVSTIVSLGQSFEMKIVAEGVETKEQYEFLRDIFCDEIQGYYFSRPIPEEEYRQLMIKEVSIEGLEEKE